MNKKGIIGTLLIVLAITLVIIGIIIGITAFQAYNLIKTVQTEANKININSNAINNGDCSKLSEVESSIITIIASAEGACKNPLIKAIVRKIQQIPLKCEDLQSFKIDYQGKITPLKNTCANKTISITNSTSA